MVETGHFNRRAQPAGLNVEPCKPPLAMTAATIARCFVLGLFRFPDGGLGSDGGGAARGFG